MLDVCKHNLMQNKRTGSRRKNSGRDPEKDFRHENKTEKERKTTAPINETNWRGASNYTGAVGGESKCICIHDYTKRKLYQSISPFDE
ncbi:hypothetical protein DPMN_142070 [Dreissena polymorpha]|uniref:Uncharacterized protein n=1 Tax=Dreissena polymorpha TaxID=45954 RepID=A0A9D4JIU9_DREPO|nr:hypothetical protein DPMN_142070 [Dreissena polymorpha]